MDQKISWEKKWISEVYIQAGSTSREEDIEHLAYDLGDIIADLGGYLGLFLGWSLLSMTFYFAQLLRNILSYYNFFEKASALAFERHAVGHRDDGENTGKAPVQQQEQDQE